MNMSFIKIFQNWFNPKKETVKNNGEHYTDIFGNTIHEGDDIIRVCYNDKRLKYATILYNYDVIPFKKNMRFNVISYMAYNDAVRMKSQKDGFIHVYRA